MVGLKIAEAMHLPAQPAGLPVVRPAGRPSVSVLPFRLARYPLQFLKAESVSRDTL